MTLVRQATSGVKWNGLTMAVRIGLQFVTLVVLARLLDPSDFGLMSMAIVITGFANAFSDFGLSNAIIHRQDATRNQLSSLYWFNLVIGLMVFILVWIAIPLAVSYYRESTLTPVLEWSAVTFLLIPLGQQFRSLLKRELRFRVLSLVQILRSIVYATIAITLATYGFGVMSLVWGTLFAEALVAGTLLIVAFDSNWLPRLHFRVADLPPFISFGLFQMGERTLNYLGNNVDYLIIGRFLGAEPLGYYTLAYSIMRIPLLYVNPVIVTVAFPTFARVQDQDGTLRRGYAKILRYLSAVSFPIMVGMFVVAPLFVTVIYGTRWLPAVPVIQIFAALGILKTLGNPLGSLLLAKGRADLGFYMSAVAVVGYFASNLLGIRYGITGVAFSSLVFSLSILLPIDFYFRWRLIRMPARDFLVAIRRAVVASGAVGIVVAACNLVLPTTNAMAALITLVGIGATTYAAILCAFDRQFLIEAWGYMSPSSVKEHR